MQTEFFEEDVISLSGLKVNPSKVVNRTNDSHRPVLLTSRGRGVAIVQSLEDYEKDKEELAFVKAIVRGLLDAKEGKTSTQTDARKELGR